MTKLINSYKVGDLVFATAGRENGKMFLVLDVEGNTAVISDGKSRKIAGAKRKNIKHLRHAGVKSERLANYRLGDNLTDAEIRKEIVILREGVL